MNYNSTEQTANLYRKTPNSPSAAVTTVLIKAQVTPTACWGLDKTNFSFNWSVSVSVFFWFSSEGTYSEGKVTPSLWDNVALLPEQAQQQVLGVLGPTVDPGVLEPVGDMSLKYRQSGSVSVSQKGLQADEDVIQMWPVATTFSSVLNIHCAGLGHFHMCYVMKRHRTSVPMLNTCVKPTSPWTQDMKCFHIMTWYWSIFFFCNGRDILRTIWALLWGCYARAGKQHIWLNICRLCINIHSEYVWFKQNPQLYRFYG